MGKGIELAKIDNPHHAAAIDNLKDQLLIVLMKRLGGKISIPVEEIDNTGQDLFVFNIQGRVFNFEIIKKS